MPGRKSIAVSLATLILGFTLGYSLGGLPGGLIGGGAEAGEVREIPVGALLLLSGAQASYGKRGQAALQLALEDINGYVERLGLKIRFKLLVEDSKTDPQVALERLQVLASLGVKAVVGPYTSAETAAVKNFADSNKVLVVSPASISSKLALPGDFVFRTIVPSRLIAWTLARAVVDRGHSKVAVIYRGDTWGEDLYLSFKDRFEELGGEIRGIRYDPQTADFSAEVAKLADAVRSLGEGTAVVGIVFEKEGIQILSLAGGNDVLSGVEWFGSSATVGSDRIKDQVGDIAVRLGGFISPLYSPPKTEEQERFSSRFRERYGEDPDTFSMNAYDTLWLIALAVIQLGGEYDGEKLAEVLPLVASKFYGVTGRLLLDENGDRVGETCSLWKIVGTEEGYKWVEVGGYSFISDRIEWYGPG